MNVPRTMSIYKIKLTSYLRVKNSLTHLKIIYTLIYKEQLKSSDLDLEIIKIYLFF